MMYLTSVLLGYSSKVPEKYHVSVSSIFGHVYPRRVSVKAAEPTHFKNLQGELRRLWKDNIGTESPVNQ